MSKIEEVIKNLTDERDNIHTTNLKPPYRRGYFDALDLAIKSVKEIQTEQEELQKKADKYDELKGLAVAPFNAKYVNLADYELLSKEDMNWGGIVSESIEYVTINNNFRNVCHKNAEEVLQEIIAYGLPSELKKQLEEQSEPVEVPSYVAEWISLYKNREYTFYQAVSYLSGYTKRWYLANSALCESAWVNSYTVQQEQLYYVYDEKTNQYLGEDKVNGKVWWLLESNSGARAMFTESEIKAKDERYMAFAVKVEEEQG